MALDRGKEPLTYVKSPKIVDFTLSAYKRYLQAIKSSYHNIYTFEEFFLTKERPRLFCLIRHDVDRRPKNALHMAILENKLGIRASYYFRARPRVFKAQIIKRISALGHEIGYHYECLSDAGGDIHLALKDFEKNLLKFSKIADIRTISMHGSPLKPIDNRDLWRDPERHRLLKEKYGILGEIYLDIDYNDIAYISDTGRNWSTDQSNIRDRVKSGVKLDFSNGEELHRYLASGSKHPLVFQVHPERWTNNISEYCLALFRDIAANAGKRLYALQTSTNR